MKIKTTAMALLALSGAAMYALSDAPTLKSLRQGTDSSGTNPSATFATGGDSDNSIRRTSRTQAGGIRSFETDGILAASEIPTQKSPQMSTTDNVELYGTLVYSASLTPGLYKIPTSDAGSFELKTTEGKPAKNGSAVFDGKMIYPIKYPTGETMMRTISLSDWSLVSETPVGSEILGTAAVYDPTTDAVYGCYYYDDDTECGFFIGHYPEGKVSMIADLDKNPMAAMAVDGAGQLYCIDYNGILFKIDKTSGTLTTVGNTGVVSQYNTSGAIDPATGIFYFAKSTDAGGWLYSIDTATAEATLLTTFASEEEIGGMFVMPDSYNINAPGAPTDLRLEFENGSADGKISFKAPETNGDGNTGRGSINYTVRANGVNIAAGTTEYGKEISVEASLAGGTVYTVSVFASNSVGEGPRTRATQFIGNDTPCVPNVHATFLGEENAIFLEWDPITTGGSNGYINPEEVTYTITRVGDNQVLSESQADTYYKDTSFGSGTKFQYKVTATYGDKTSAPGLSNIIDMTVKYPPYIETFETKDPFTNDYTFIGSGKGDNKWTYYKSKKIVRAYYDFDYPKDEWLITPAIMLEAGKKYKFSFLTYTGSNSYEEHLEVFMGNECSVAGMTDKIVDKTWADKTEQTVEVMVEPAETGKYYFGFHACSDADCHYIYIDDISVSAPTGENVPMAPSDLTVTPGEDCAKSATVSFTAPTMSIKGSALESLDKIEIYRETALVNTIENPEPGKEYSYVDEVPGSTTYTYAVYAYNSDGMGNPAKASAYVGIKAPEAPGSVTLTETSTPGTVTIDWEPSATYFDGTPINPEFVQYAIRQGKSIIVQGLTEPTYTFKALEPEQQNFLQFEVVAVTEGGTSASGTFSNVLLCGSPQPAPYSESFKNGYTQTPIATQSVSGDGSWKTCSDKSFAQISSQDGDNGYLSFAAANAGASAAMLTGRYSLEGITGAALTFYTLPVGDISQNQNTIKVSVDDGNGWVDIKEIVMKDLFDQQKWNKVTVPLSQYDGKTIQLKITFINNSYVYSYIDNIVLGGIDMHNLTPMSVNAPYMVSPGEEFDVSVYIANNGIATTGKYQVYLLLNEEEVASMEGDAQECGTLARFDFKQTLGITGERENIYRATVEYDKNPADVFNESEGVMTTVTMPLVPAVSDLDGSSDPEGIILEWSEPDASEAAPAAVCEDFESYPSWTYGAAIGNWEMIDGDGSVIGGPSQYGFPGIPGIGQGKLAYFLIDNSWEGISGYASYGSHSGSKFISSMYCYDGNQNDDWIISPELYGGHQIVSIWARSFDARYPEAIEVLYSTGGRDRADFKHAVSVDPLPEEWTEVRAVMPAGTKYFALRTVSFDAFMMFADDFSYIPAGTPENLSLTGYNIYRDGEKITDSPVSDRRYTDRTADFDDHTYFVTAVYSDKGESPASNIVSARRSSGLDNLETGTMKVLAAGGKLIVKGAHGTVTVTDAAGRLLHISNGEESFSIEAAPGVYLLKDRQRTVKAIAR